MTHVASNDHDRLNELLIAKLLEEDMQMLENTLMAEELQVHETLNSSAMAAGRFPKKRMRTDAALKDDQDHNAALGFLAAEVRANKDALLAQSLQHTEDSNMAIGRQYALKLAASEKKSLLDAEFARRLQQALDDGEDVDMTGDAESMLGRDAIEDIIASDMNDKGKGKTTAPKRKAPPSQSGNEEDDDAPSSLYPTCGICLEPFQATYSPVSAARSANSSARLQFGTKLPCPRSHGYCISCLNTYITTKLDPEGTGVGNMTAVIFPIRCPECPVADWPQGLPDTVAERVLSEKGMILWHHQKLLDSLPKYYCPNPRCSALVQVDEGEEDPQAVCPSCESTVCIPCRVLWHDGMNCEEYQELPLDERSPDDQKAIQLMRAQHWRRCPKCSMIIELTMGCNHITCRCKAEFCFKCGALWDIKKGLCSREPSCELWDDDMLLEQRERERERVRANEQRQNLAQNQVRVAYEPPPPPYEPDFEELFPDVRWRAANLAQMRQDDTDDLSWMDDDGVLCTRHWFTSNMIRELKCQYCHTALNSLADLQYHLSRVRRHQVFACCGRFFKHEIDFERHQDAKDFHAHTVRRNRQS